MCVVIEFCVLWGWSVVLWDMFVCCGLYLCCGMSEGVVDYSCVCVLRRFGERLGVVTV